MRKGGFFLKLWGCTSINGIRSAASGTAVPLAALSAHPFSIKPVNRPMPSHHQLAAISPKMNIIPAAPTKQPSDAASVSADTMMNSYRHPSCRKELFSFKTLPRKKTGSILHTASAGSDSFPNDLAATIKQYMMKGSLCIPVCT